MFSYIFSQYPLSPLTFRVAKTRATLCDTSLTPRNPSPEVSRLFVTLPNSSPSPDYASRLARVDRRRESEAKVKERRSVNKVPVLVSCAIPRVQRSPREGRGDEGGVERVERAGIAHALAAFALAFYRAGTLLAA